MFTLDRRHDSLQHLRNTPPQEADKYLGKVRTRVLDVDRMPSHELMIAQLEELG
jgi:hypothetical protein